MAGRGFAPSDPAGRRNRVQPARGDWTDLPAKNSKRPPAMPAEPRGGWGSGTKLAWKAWWADPASLMWSPADVETLRQLAYLHHDLDTSPETRGKATLAAEIRQRMDGLGLTQKGKRDFRWRVVPDETAGKRTEKKKAKPPKSQYGHLRAVRNAVEGT